MISLAAIEDCLHRIFVAAPGTGLREEDRKKAVELVGMLSEIERALAKRGKSAPFRMVDAAAGKAYVGLLAAEFLLAPKGRAAHVTLIEREPARAAACASAIQAVRAPEVTFSVEERDVADPTAWPKQPDLVVALHACGPASDDIIRQAIACQAGRILLVPCCTSDAVSGARRAAFRADQLGWPRHAEVRRRFVQAMVDAERTLMLETAGYETAVVSFVPPTVTPHHLLWRARRVCESGRMADAEQRLLRLRAT